MALIEQKTKEHEIIIDDVSYRIKQPSVGQFYEFKKESEKLDEFQASLNFFKSLGMEEAGVMKMTPETMMAVIQALSGEKKS